MKRFICNISCQRSVSIAVLSPKPTLISLPQEQCLCLRLIIQEHFSAQIYLYLSKNVEFLPLDHLSDTTFF